MANEPVKIKLVPNGPARVQTGEFEIELTDGSIVKKEGPFSLCRCGASANKPFCDGSHRECGFEG